ncbi:MAG: AAA family ATPase [Nitrosomonadaceae bacterium]
MTKAPPVPDDVTVVKKLPKPPAAPASARKPAAGKQKKKVEIKTFHVASWSGANEGEKIIGYADSGMGKTTLAALSPTPVFLGVDDGGRKIKDPRTGEELRYIPGVEIFDDFRQAVQQPDLFNDYQTVVIDTGTILESWAHDWMLQNIPTEKGGPASNIEKYGWGKGHRHLYDTMRLPLADFDALVRRGKNILILCQMQQVTVANAGGEDFLCDAPKLAPQHGKTPSVWGLWTEWADHVFKIGYSDFVAKDKKAKSSSERLIFLHGQAHFKAKSRTVPGRFPLVSFADPTDDSLWQFIFDEAWKNIPEEE